MGEIVIQVENVGMQYNLSKEKVDNLKEYVIKFLKRQLKFTKFWAVRGVSFEVEKGDKFGIIGLNGAGKSTLLKLISGVIKPTEGTITIKGNIVPLLELGSGFDQEYTGRENIYLKGALLGYSKEYIREKVDEIIEFSDLGDFIDVPLKNYSTGMSARLAFGIATSVDPEIMILDEVLAVGDAKFREKSEARMKSLLGENVTVLFVSHTLTSVRQMCNNAIWLEKGRLVMEGPVDEVCDKYEEWVLSKEDFIVTESKPKQNEQSFPVDKNLVLTFNEEIKVEENSWIELVPENGDPVPIYKHVDGNVLTLEPIRPLEYDTEYLVVLHSKCLKDIKGHELNAYSIVFTTESEK